jgi:hydroxypyruvate isomerase
MPRFAANLTTMFGEVSFRDRFAAASAAGFGAVECLFPYELPKGMVAELLETHQLALALFNLAPGNWAAGERGLAALPDRRLEFRQSVSVAIEYAMATGCRKLHMMAGNAPSDDPSARESYLESLAFAADIAGEQGLTIVIEPINRRDMGDYFLCDFGVATDLIAASKRPNVRLQYDIYHRQILHGDVARSLEALMPLIGHIQIASVPLRHEPGTGELNDFYLFDLIDRLDYQGYVGCEYHPAAGTLEGLAWFSSRQRFPLADAIIPR